MTTTDDSRTNFMSAVHPPFCEGGISCERQQSVPASWEHRGRETTFHVKDTRIDLALVRYDGRSRGEGYGRGEVEVSLKLTETAFFDKDGNEISVEVLLGVGDMSRLRSFIDEYDAKQRWYNEHEVFSTYDGPADELPKRHGMTKAQQVWNAIALGEDLGRQRGEDQA